MPVMNSEPAWLSAFQQVLDSEPQNRFVQVATVREGGKPACRTMGFSGFMSHRGTPQALLQTHAKSYKAEQLALSSWVEICCWDAATQQQFRLLGPVEVVDDDTTDHSLQSKRQEEWKKLNEPSVLQWYQNADRAPGHSYKPPVPLPINSQGKAPPNFLMLVVDILEVDYVHLESDTRAIWRKDRANMADIAGSADRHVWCKEEVNP